MRTVLACHPDYGKYCGEGMTRLAAAGGAVQLNPNGRLFTTSELHTAAADAGAVIAGTEPWDEAAFSAARRLRFLVRFGTGMNSVNLEVAKRRGVIVAKTPGHNANAAAEQTVALHSGKIGGLAADVFEDEPPHPDNPLFACPNYLCSPHISGSTRENMRNTGLAAAEAVLDVFAGREPKNRHA